MPRQLDHFGQPLVGGKARYHEARLDKLLAKRVAYLITMPVPFVDEFRSICGESAGARQYLAGVGAQTHRAALVLDVFLFGHEVNDERYVIGAFQGSLVGELGRRRAVESRHMAGELADCRLQSQANAQIGNVMLACIPSCGYLSLEGALAETAGHEDAVHGSQDIGSVGVVELLAVDEVDAGVRSICNAGVPKRLDDGKVCVRQARVLAHDGDVGLARTPGGCFHVIGHRNAMQLAFRQLQALQHLYVETLVEQVDGNLVDARGIHAAQHGIDINVAEMRDLRPHSIIDLVVGTADDEIGLHAHAAHLLHGMLRGLRLHLVRSGDVGYEAHMDEHDVVGSEFVAQLAHRLDERLALDVADGAADFGDHDMRSRLAGSAQHALLDGVGYMWDDLHRAAEEVAASFTRDERLVNRALREIRFAREALVDETLVMAQVEVAFVPVVGNEDLAMLKRRHRAGIDIQVWVHLLHSHPVSARFQQMPERCGGDALAERRDDAACHEDVFSHVGLPSPKYEKAPGGRGDTTSKRLSILGRA